MIVWTTPLKEILLHTHYKNNYFTLQLIVIKIKFSDEMKFMPFFTLPLDPSIYLDPLKTQLISTKSKFLHP